MIAGHSNDLADHGPFDMLVLDADMFTTEVRVADGYGVVLARRRP